MRRWFPACFLISLALGCGQDKSGPADGATIYQDACARCHGQKGVPSKGMAARTGVKPLTSERVRNEVSDGQMRVQILKGSRSKTMPGFEGALSDEQITAVIAHVRSLGAEPAPEAKSAN